MNQNIPYDESKIAHNRKAVLKTIVPTCIVCPHCKHARCRVTGVDVKDAVKAHAVHVSCPYLEPPPIL